MFYGLITKESAEQNLIDCYGRSTIDDQIIIHEFDIMRCNVQGETLAERADRLGTRLYTIQELKELKNQ